MWFIPIGNEFVAEVTGIDLRAPLDAGATAAIHAAMDRSSYEGLDRPTTPPPSNVATG